MDDTNIDQEVFERLLKVSFSKIIPSLRFKLLKKIKVTLPLGTIITKQIIEAGDYRASFWTLSNLQSR